jgi:hypothetical protein
MLTFFVTIGDRRSTFERGRMAAIGVLGRQRPDAGAASVHLTGVPSRPAGGTMLSLMALFFGDTYK